MPDESQTVLLGALNVVQVVVVRATPWCQEPQKKSQCAELWRSSGASARRTAVHSATAGRAHGRVRV